MDMTWTGHGRRLKTGQRSELTIIDTVTGARRVLMTSPHCLEAPNWLPDGQALVFNAGGRLWRIAVDASRPAEPIASGTITDFNNDHVVSPDGRLIYASSDDGHIYRLPVTGGDPVRISNSHDRPFHYYLHGISPDGSTLSYVAVEELDGRRRINVYLIGAAGGPDLGLTDDDFPDDGPEFSPDGVWLYFNSERARRQPGHAQIFRMRLSDRHVEQLTHDERVNWFAHPAPDGRRLAYLSYPEGTTGHPADREVIIRLMDPEGGPVTDLVSLFGGQGTINVNSWAPDSRHLAYVAYPEA